MTTLPYGVVKVFRRQDRKRRVIMTERGGFYSFHEEGETFDLGEAYWTTISGGGLHATPDDANSRVN